EIYRAIKGNLKKNSAYLSKHDDLVNKFMTTPKNITFNQDSISNIITMATSIEEHIASYKKHLLIHIDEFIETMWEIVISETVSTED
uniref:hypothetical protein n=1 Tax=Pseudomonas sp. HY13-MNA-CIBAN-0226 TaxID=3140473 RepID=UPI0033236B93